MTKREMISRAVHEYFRETNKLKIKLSDAVVVVEDAGISASVAQIGEILRLDVKEGYLFQVKMGEFMLGHRSRD